MQRPKFATVKRGRSTANIDAETIKIKRNETPDDILSALLKKGVEDDDERQEDDEEGEDNESNEDERETEQQRRHISHGQHSVQGKMRHGMEDYLVATRKMIEGREVGLYAIFDGHSGKDAAEYLQNHLFDNILNQPDFWTNPKAAVKRAYLDTDKDILENVVGSRGGSTAVTAILINREELVVANVGDSRAVLCKNGSAKQISVDHEPIKERKMVESRGGFVSHKPGNVPRVDGQLAMTRAFGDEKLKEHITADPHVAIEKMGEDAEFIILASDGVWKVMSNEEAVECVRGLQDGQEAAQELIKEALVRESKDDVSCVVVMFHQ